MASKQPHWEQCSKDDCLGIRLPTTTWCLAHAAEQAPDAFEDELARISAEGTVDARGVLISAELLGQLLDAAPGTDDQPTLEAARFDQATFQDDARFAGVSFQGMAAFAGASFQGVAWFGRASFQDAARFGRASFQDAARFERASFQDRAVFEGASFQGKAAFYRASFQGDAAFDEASFQGDASFNRVDFQDRAGFDGASFQGEAGFGGANFERAALVGPLLARQLVLDGAVFGVRVQLRVAAAAVCARRVQFRAGVHLRLRYATVVLDDADLAAPAIIAGAPAVFPELGEREQQIARGWARLPPGPRQQRWRPRLLSIQRADVAGLRLAEVDLRACRFAGAHNLDRLRVEGAPLFARTTGWWRARRKTLAEEQHWRATRPGRRQPAGWYLRACQPPASPKAEVPAVVEPARLAAVYRELRKGREDAKDEPGAADFYYGECEMRRHDPTTARAERLVLLLYWLLSGYALRAWRALAALAVVVVLAGTVLAFWGFPAATPTFRPAAVDRGGALVYRQQLAAPPAGLGRLPEAIRFSARSATALLRGPDRALTPLGEWLEIGLRFTGPLLLGLAVLSVRGRVRR